VTFAVCAICAVVYRGCADSRNLPLGVDSSVQCREQGKPTAVWWFCNDTLCNSDQFNTVCSVDSSHSNSGLTFIQHPIVISSLNITPTLETYLTVAVAQPRF